jgi:predicted peptidase
MDRSIASSDAPLKSSRFINLIVDDFKQLEYTDAKTGAKLAYNLFIPKNYDPKKSYPLGVVYARCKHFGT